METDVKGFITNIRENTGIEFGVYTPSGEYVYGENGLRIPPEFDGVFADSEQAKTFFKFRYKNKKLVGVLNGVDSTAKNYAYLISELADHSLSKGNIGKEEFFKAVLVGEASDYNIKKMAKKYAGNSKSCAMLLSVVNGKEDEVLTVVNGYLEGGFDFACKMEDGLIALVKFFDNEASEYRSVSEYAEFLVRFIYEETGVNAGVYIGGTVDNIADLSVSFGQAVAAQRLNEAITGRVGVHSFKEFMMVKMLEDLPKHKLSEYLGTLLEPSAREIFEDKEMINTAEEFFANSLNVSETARKLYLHRNTLNYRLDKIEKATGLNISKIPDAITFRMITIILKMVR